MFYANNYFEQLPIVIRAFKSLDCCYKILCYARSKWAHKNEHVTSRHTTSENWNRHTWTMGDVEDGVEKRIMFMYNTIQYNTIIFIRSQKG